MEKKITVYSDTWSWLKLDKKNELLLNNHIMEHIDVLITDYELNRRKKNDCCN